MTLAVDTRRTPTTARRVFSAPEAALLATKLIDASICFYLEPEPFDHFVFFLNHEVGSQVDQIMFESKL